MRIACAFVCLLGGLGGGVVTAQVVAKGDRVTDGLVALYTFEPPAEFVVDDVSDVGEPMALRPRGHGSLVWPQAVFPPETPGVAALTSDGPATKLNRALRDADAFTIEAWVQPDNVTQGGPARIATLSISTAGERNFTLGQAAGRYIVRLRTSEAGVADSYREYQSTDGVVKAAPQHVVVTFLKCPLCGSTRLQMYVDGENVLDQAVVGDLSTWSLDYPLTVGNESTDDRQWAGTVGLLAFYDRSLRLEEMAINQQAGCEF